MKTKSTHVSEEKIKTVAELKDLIKNHKTVLIASIKNLPASQFQEIGKKLRKKAIIKVPKKNLIFRAIDDSENKAIKKLKEQVRESVAILFSDLDSFDLALELIKNKSPAKAKPGQIAPYDIEIKAGMTELVPGPAISELGAVGIITKVTKGKLEITKDKVIVREGKEISQAAADIMAKLDIKPFSIGFIPICSFDVKAEKLYCDIKIDKDEVIENLKLSFGKALGFAVEISYVNDETIKFLLSKAEMHGKALEKFGEKEKIAEADASDDKKIDNKEDNSNDQPKTDNNDVEAEGPLDNGENKLSEPASEQINTPENKSEETN